MGLSNIHAYSLFLIPLPIIYGGDTDVREFEHHALHLSLLASATHPLAPVVAP